MLSQAKFLRDSILNYTKDIFVTSKIIKLLNQKSSVLAANPFLQKLESNNPKKRGRI